jgi:CRP-like cAMP-binding protein
LQLLREALRVLFNSPLFYGLSDIDKDKLIPLLKPVLMNYEEDSVIIEEGDFTDRIGFVISGKVAARKMASGGRIHILAVHEAGDNFGFDAVFSTYKTSPLTFTAETDCIALFISAEPFLNGNIDASIRLMSNTNRILADKCVRLLYKTDILTKQSMRERIMTYFNIMITKRGSNSFALNMTREQFAQYLGVNRSALCRELSRMKDEGLIELKSGGDITVNIKKQPKT